MNNYYVTIRLQNIKKKKMKTHEYGKLYSKPISFFDITQKLTNIDNFAEFFSLLLSYIFIIFLPPQTLGVFKITIFSFQSSVIDIPNTNLFGNIIEMIQFS